MVDWKKAYSTWWAVAVAVVGAAAATVQFVTDSGVLVPTWVLVAIGAAGVFFRKLPQGKDDDNNGPGPGASGILLVFLLTGCVSNTAREACYAASRAQFIVDQEQCDDEACIDALLARRKAEQEACP